MPRAIPEILPLLASARARRDIEDEAVRRAVAHESPKSEIAAARRRYEEAGHEAQRLQDELADADKAVRKSIDRQIANFEGIRRDIESERQATFAEILKTLPDGLFTNETRALSAMNLSVLGENDRLGQVPAMGLSWELAADGGRRLRQPTENLPHVIAHIENRTAEALDRLGAIKSFRKSITKRR